MKRVSGLTIALGLYIIISSTFMLQVRNFFVGIFGEGPIGFLFLVSFSVLAAFYTLHIFRMRVPFLKITFSVSVFLLAYLLISKQEYFAEKLHVVEYGLLGFLLLRDLLEKRDYLKNIAVAVFFICVVSFLDEGLQGILPYRFFEFKDISTNIISGLLGIGLGHSGTTRA